MSRRDTRYPRDFAALGNLPGYQPEDTRSESNYSQDSQPPTHVASPPTPKPEARPQSKVVDYRPTALRWWFHLALIICLATLIGLTEWAVRYLNIHEDGTDDFVSTAAAPRSIERSLGYRQRSRGMVTQATLTRPNLNRSFYPLTRQHQIGHSPESEPLPFKSDWPEAKGTTIWVLDQVKQSSTASIGDKSEPKASASTALGKEHSPQPTQSTISDRSALTASPMLEPGAVVSSRNDKNITAIMKGIGNGTFLLATYAKFLKPGKIKVHHYRFENGTVSAGDTAQSKISGSDFTRARFEDRQKVSKERRGGSELVGVEERMGRMAGTNHTTDPSKRSANVSLASSSISRPGTTSDSGTTMSHSVRLHSMTGPFYSTVVSAFLVTGKTSTIVDIAKNDPEATTTLHISAVHTSSKNRPKETFSKTESTDTIEPSKPNKMAGSTHVEAPTPQDTSTGHARATANGAMQTSKPTHTDDHENIASFIYTGVDRGTPTVETLVAVQATSMPSSHEGTVVPLVVPVTSPRKNETRKTIYTDAQGHIRTSSYTTLANITATSTTLWVLKNPTQAPSSGNSSASSGGNSSSSTGSSSDTGEAVVYGISMQEYVIGAFLPTALAVLIAFPIKLIGINARLMQPFHALASANPRHGTRAEASVFLRFYGLNGLVSFIRAIRMGQPIVAISDILVLGSGLLAPLAAETVTVYAAIDDCEYFCRGNLGSSVVSGRVLEGLMGALIACLLALVFLLTIRQWKTGVAQNPWSIAGVASLSLNAEMRTVLRSMPAGKESTILKALSTRRYALSSFGSSWDTKAKDGGYGITVAYQGPVTRENKDDLLYQVNIDGPRTKKSAQPFMLLTWWGRSVMLFIFVSMLIIVVYYEESSASTGFEQFMDSQGYGVKFFFTALGVVLGYCMETVFRCVAIMSPYLKMRDYALPAEQSILLSPPTNAFYGIWSAFRQRHLYLGLLSFVTLLAELGLPVTLSHVPFSAVETFTTQVVCTWLTTAILSLMSISLVVSFFIRWPNMPVDPRTVAGAMYYVCDSWMLESLDSVSTLDKVDRDLDVRYMRHKYGYGYINGMSRTSRLGVDIIDNRDEEERTGQKPLYRYVTVL